MRKRLLCGFLTLLLLLQAVPMETYAVENNPVQQVTEETESSVEPDTTEVPSTVEEETTETTVVEEETTTTEETTVSEEEPTDAEEITVESTIVEEETTTEEVTTEENGVENGILSDETEKPAEIKNLRVESVGYQKAMIVFEVECKEGVSVNYVGGFECSEETLSDTKVSFYNYKNEEGKKVEGTYYMMVEVQPNVTLSYVPSIEVTDENGTVEKIISTDAIKITGLSFDLMKPTVSAVPYVEKAYFKLNVENYCWEIDSSLKIEVYHRIYGESEWINGFSGEMSFSKDGIDIEANGFSENTKYECYFEILDKNGTDSVAKTNTIIFTTERDVIYTREDFPDDGFYEVITDLIRSAEITQSALDKIRNVSVSTDLNDIYSNSVPVKSIEGIQYFRNARYINLGGQQIEDASQIENLTKLEGIDLNSNNIKTVPNMSKLSRLKELQLEYNMIPKSEFTDDKLSEYFINDGWYSNWKRCASYQRTGEEEIITVPVCYGWGESYPVVFGLKNAKRNVYKIVLTVGDQIYEKTKKYYGTKTGVTEATAIPNTQLVPGEYSGATIEIYDVFNKKVTEKTFDFSIKPDESTYNIMSLSFASGDYFSFSGELINVNQKISKIEIVKDSSVYAQTTNVSSYLRGDYSWSYNKRYYEILGDYVTAEDYEAERKWVEYIAISLHIEKDLHPGNYDILFTLADDTTCTLKDKFVVNDTPKVFDVDYVSTYDNYKYNNVGDYFYVRLKGYHLDENKVYPELYAGDKLVTEFSEMVEKTEILGSEEITEYIYKLKKVDIETYWKESCEFRWKLHVNKDYLVEDAAEEHTVNYRYTDWREKFNVGMIWVDDYLTKNSMHIYFDSEVEDDTKVKLEVQEEHNSSEGDRYISVGTGEGTIKDQVLKLDLYDQDGNIYYPRRIINTYRYIYDITYKDGSTTTITQDHVGAYDVTGSFSTTVYDYVSTGSCTLIYVPRADYITTFKGFQLGKRNIPSVIVDIYLPGTYEKIKTIETEIDDRNAYLFKNDDLKSLEEGQPYLVCICDKDGKRKIKSFFGYLVAGTKPSATIKPTKITLNTTSLTLGIGETGQLKATVSPTNATNKSVTWKSSDAAVATVDKTGKITAVAEGTAVITASTYNGLQAKCNITVYQSEGESITLKPEEEYTISIPGFVNAKTAKFTSLDTDVAKVSSNGVVSGIGLGETKVILQSGSIKITYPVTVINPLTSIRFEEDNLSVEVGENVTNAIIFTPALTESSKDLSVTVEDESVASAEVSGRNIRVQGIKAGTTKITANVGDLSTECQITVLSPIEVPQLSETEVYAFVNRDKKLGDLEEQLPEGFRFAEPETLLAQFTGVSEKEFAVIYTDETGRQKESVQKVRFVTISGISVEAEKTSVAADGKDKSIISVGCEWTGYEAPEEKKEEFLNEHTFELSVDKTDIAAIEQDNDLYVLKGLSKGKATVTAVLRKAGTQGKDGILFKKTLGILVTEKVVNLQVSVTGAEYNSEKDYYVVENISDANVIVEGAAEEYKVKWSSSDTAVATIGKTTGNQTSVTIKSNGKVKLTATANDPAKTSKSIMLYVIDTKPSIDGQITINKALEGGGTMGIYASYGYQIEQYDVQIMQAQNEEQSDNRFSIDYNIARDVYEVCIADGADVKEGKYDVIIRVTANTENGKKTYCEKAVITVVNKPVTYSVKQSKKVNLFYSDEEGNGVLTISCKNAVIQSAELSDCDFSYDYETGEISFTGDNYENPDEEGVLTITFEGYKEVSKNINISSEVKKPKITTSASSSVIYPNAGVKTAKIQLNDATSGKTLVISNGNINQESLENDAYKAYAQDGEVCYALKENVTNYPASAKITFKLQMSNWNDEIAISHTIKSNMASNLSVILSNGTVTLNKNDILAKYQSEEVSMKVKNATETAIDTVAVAGADKKSVSAMNQGLDFAFDDETGKLAVWFNDSSKVDTGTYTYSLSANIEEGSKAKTKLKVKVLDKEPEKSVTVSTKGTIDIIDRKNTSVVCTAKFTNISGKITNVKLTGQDAHLFEVSLNEKNQAVIKAGEDVAYITKYPYKVQLVYTLNSGSRDYRVTSKPLSLKLKQGKVSITANLTSTWLYQAADNAVNVELNAMNSKGNKLEISDVTLAEIKDLKGAFTLAYDETAQCYKLAIQDSGKVKKNKTYTLKLNVRTKEQADNEKPISVSVKVKVK